MSLIPKLQGVTYAGSGPQPYAPSPGPGGSEYGGEWEKPVTNPVSQIIQQIQAQGLPPTVENVNRVRQQAPQRLPTPPIPPQPGPDRTVEPYQPQFSDGGNDNTSALPPKRGPQMPPPGDVSGGTPRPPDGSGDPVTQGNPRAPSPQAVGLPEPGGPAQPLPFLGRDILNLRPLLQMLTTPMSPGALQTLHVPGAEQLPEPPIAQQPQIAGPPKQLALPAPAGQPATPTLPAPPRQLALPAPAPQAQAQLPAPDPIAQSIDKSLQEPETVQAPKRARAPRKRAGR